MEMTKRKGFALVEAIAAMALLAFVAVTMFTLLANSAEHTRRMRYVTRDNFTAVHEVELQIREVARILDDPAFAAGTVSINPDNMWANPVLLWGGTNGGVELFSDMFDSIDNSHPYGYSYFSSLPPVQAYIVHVGNQLMTLVGRRPPRYEAPSVESLVATFSGSVLPGSPGLANFVTGFNTSITANGVALYNEENAAGENIFGGVDLRWWVSREGFSTVIQPDSVVFGDESDTGAFYLFPRFPEDFTVIPAPQGYGLGSAFILEEFAGRFITLVATPFSTVGRLGDPVASNFIYIMDAVPVQNGLVSHFRAGLIDRLVMNPNTDYDYYYNYVLNWNDLINPAAAENTISTVDTPILFFHPAGQPGYEIMFSTVSFYTAPDSGLRSYRPTPPTNGLTVFVVASQPDIASITNDTILEGEYGINDIWSLGFDGFTVNSNTASGASHTRDTFYVTAGRVDVGSTNATIRHNLNHDYATVSVPASSINLNYSILSIGNTFGSTGMAADVAEILIFDRALTDAEFDEVLDFLLTRYRIE